MFCFNTPDMPCKSCAEMEATVARGWTAVIFIERRCLCETGREPWGDSKIVIRTEVGQRSVYSKRSALKGHRVSSWQLQFKHLKLARLGENLA